MSFSFIDHDAEIGLELEAADEAGLLEEAVRGFAALVTDLATIRCSEVRSVTVRGTTPEERLVLWLREWVFAADADGFLPAAARVVIGSDGTVTGTVEGERRDPARHPGLREIKAVTWHQVASGSRAGRWSGRVILDV